MRRHYTGKPPLGPEIPTEHNEQVALFQWADLAAGAMPELNLMHAIPNGGFRNKIVAAKLKAEGVKPGIPDICLPVPRERFHGLYVELKRLKGGSTSSIQNAWHEALRQQGYAVAVCKGWEHARETIQSYLQLPPPRFAP